MKLEFEDGELSTIIMAAIARSAKGFDSAIDANQWGNLAATEQDIADWQAMSKKLWDVVKQFSNSSE